MSEDNPYLTMATNWFDVPPAPGLKWVFKHKPKFVRDEHGNLLGIEIHPEDAHLLDLGDGSSGIEALKGVPKDE